MINTHAKTSPIRPPRAPIVADTMDLDQFNDNLPQPFRMIQKIIELEILDVAWLEIIRKHPDIELGSDGKQIRLPRNQQLTCSCNPTMITERPFKASSVTAVDDFLLATSAISGSFHVMDAKSGRNMSTVALPVLESSETKLWVASVSKCTNMNNPVGISRIAVLSISRTAVSVDPAVPVPVPAAAVAGGSAEPAEMFSVCYSLFVLELLSGAILDGSKNHGKHYSKKPGLPAIKISVLHSKIIDTSDFDSASDRVRTDPNDLMYGFSADLSPDGETLIYTVKGQMQLFCLDPVHNTVVGLKAVTAVKDAIVTTTAQPMTTIDDEKELTFENNVTDESSPDGAVLETPNFEAVLVDMVTVQNASTPLQGAPPAGSNNAVPGAGAVTGAGAATGAGTIGANTSASTSGSVDAQCLLMFGLSVPQPAHHPKAGMRGGTVVGAGAVTSGKSAAGSVAGVSSIAKSQAAKQAVATTKPGAPPVDIIVKDNSLLAMHSLAVAVVSVMQPVLALYGLFFISPVVNLPSPPGSGRYHRQPGAVCSHQLAKWKFSGHVTATETDMERCLLLAGLNDGSVYLINLKSLTLLQCIGKHEVAVTALAFSQAFSEPNYFIVSGAGDGSMGFFKVIVTDNKGTAESNASAIDTSMTTRGFNFLEPAAPSAPPEPSQGWFGCLRAELLDYRHDFTEPVVSIKGFGKYPIVCVQSAPMLMSALQEQLNNSTVTPKTPYHSNLSVSNPGAGCYTAVYDVEAMKLMGKLVLYEGMQAQAVAWKMACREDVHHFQPSSGSSHHQHGQLNQSLSEGSIEEDNAAAVIKASATEEEKAQVAVVAAVADGLESSAVGQGADMFRRSAKFSATPIAVLQALRPYTTLSVCSASSFCGLFLRQSTGAIEPVMAVYLISNIIETLMPGIKSMLALYNETDNTDRIGGRNMSINATALYSAFTVEERWQGSFSLDSIPTRFRSLFSNVLDGRSRGGKHKGSRVILATNTSATGSNVSVGDDLSRSKMSRKFDRHPTTMNPSASQQANKLTEEKLLAFQQTIDPLSEHQEPQSVRHVGEMCSAHILNPVRIIRSSIEKNQSERIGRKNKVLKRLSYLAEAIQ